MTPRRVFALMAAAIVLTGAAGAVALRLDGRLVAQRFGSTLLPSPPRFHPGDGRSAQRQTVPTASPTPNATPAPVADQTPAPAPTPTPTANPTPITGATGVWQPKPGTSWQWQITGAVDPTVNVRMYDIDLFDAQTATNYTVPGFGTVNVPQGANPGIIGRLHASGKVVICYLDTGAWEDYRPDAALFPKSVIGAQTYASTGAAWKGEHWLDIRQTSWPLFEPLIAARLDLAKRSGCDGVEGDQNNSADNKPGFPITLADQKAWYLEIARLAHARGLSAGQKNGTDTTDADTVAAFDWNLNEECNQYSECDVLNGFIAAGKAVFQVEYTENGQTTAKFCPQDNAANFDGLLKHLDLGAWRQPCRTG